MVLANELLQHHLHRVKLTVTQATHQVHLAESAYSEAFQHLVFFQPTLTDELYAVEGQLVSFQSAFPDRDTVVQQQVVMRRLESHHQGSLEDRVAVLALQQKAVDFLVEEKGEVASLDAHGETHPKCSGLIVERDCEGAGRGVDGGEGGIELEEVLIGPGVGVRDPL